MLLSVLLKRGLPANQIYKNNNRLSLYNIDISPFSASDAYFFIP